MYASDMPVKIPVCIKGWRKGEYGEFTALIDRFGDHAELEG